jgi:dihydropyrimidinase
LSKRRNGTLYVVHVSSGSGVELLAGREGVIIESCPHYFYLTRDMLKGSYGGLYLLAPPLRSTIESAKLNKAIEDVYTIGTDHCPFTKIHKAAELPHFDAIPKGLCGLDFLVPLAFNLFQNKPQGLQKICALLSAEPARILGLDGRKGRIHPGFDADITLVRTGVPHTLKSRDELFNPYGNRETNMAVEAVFLRGIQVVRDAALLECLPKGELV